MCKALNLNVHLLINQQTPTLFTDVFTSFAALGAVFATVVVHGIGGHLLTVDVRFALSSKHASRFRARRRRTVIVCNSCNLPSIRWRQRRRDSVLALRQRLVIMLVMRQVTAAVHTTSSCIVGATLAAETAVEHAHHVSDAAERWHEQVGARVPLVVER